MAYKDAERVFRKAVFNALDGNVVYQGDTIPVYDEFASDLAPELFIVLGNQYADDRRNFAKFVTGCVIIIDVVHTQNRAMTKDVVDDVAEIVKGLLMPAVTGNGLTLDAGFSSTNLYRETSSYLSEQNNTKWVIRKIERYRVDIQQDS